MEPLESARRQGLIQCAMIALDSNPAPDSADHGSCAVAVCSLVAVLFCCDQSSYKLVAGAEVWDKKRDARRYAGKLPVVAHPPCRTWGNLRTVATKAPAEENALGPWAIEQVRRCGGVLEHPAGSTLFATCGCGKAGDAGWILEVDQWHWGHACAKPTKLYIVGCRPEDIPPQPFRAGEPDRCITQGHGIRRGHPKFKSRVTQWEREATPPAFARWLIAIARLCAANTKASDR
jgi:hypothetical protein